MFLLSFVLLPALLFLYRCWRPFFYWGVSNVSGVPDVAGGPDIAGVPALAGVQYLLLLMFLQLYISCCFAVVPALANVQKYSFWTDRLSDNDYRTDNFFFYRTIHYRNLTVGISVIGLMNVTIGLSIIGFVIFLFSSFVLLHSLS